MQNQSTCFLQSLRTRLSKLSAERDHAVRSVKAEKLALSEARESLESAKQTQNILQQIAQAVQEEVHGQIAAVVTKCLHAIFDEPYELVIDFDRKRGRTEAQLKLKKGKIVLDDPMYEEGGGVVQVAAFALRVAVLVLSQPPKRRVVFLDEPFLAVDKNNKPKLRDLLEQLSQDLGLQIVLITHDSELECGKVIRIGGEG